MKSLNACFVVYIINTSEGALCVKTMPIMKEIAELHCNEIFKRLYLKTKNVDIQKVFNHLKLLKLPVTSNVDTYWLSLHCVI